MNSAGQRSEVGGKDGRFRSMRTVYKRYDNYTSEHFPKYRMADGEWENWQSYSCDRIGCRGGIVRVAAAGPAAAGHSCAPGKYGSRRTRLRPISTHFDLFRLKITPPRGG
jgi:hypothetical protein